MNKVLCGNKKFYEKFKIILDFLVKEKMIEYYTDPYVDNKKIFAYIFDKDELYKNLLLKFPEIKKLHDKDFITELSPFLDESFKSELSIIIGLES